MVVFQTIEDFYQKRNMAASIEDILEKRKDRLFAKKIKGVLREYRDLLSIMPKQKLQKVVTAKYTLERTKGFERKIGDVETLRKMKRQRKESEKIDRIFRGILRKYGLQIKQLLRDYEKYKKATEQEMKKLEEYKKKYESAVKTYNKMVEKRRRGEGNDFSFYKAMQATKKMALQYKQKYMNCLKKINQYNTKLRSLNTAYTNLLNKVSKEWEMI